MEGYMRYDENKCCGIIGAFFGHKFEAVFEHETKNEPDPALIQALAPAAQACYERLISAGYNHPGEPFDGILEKLGTDRKTYIHHVCVRCGKTVKKS
jgi:hypothetical protein